MTSQSHPNLAPARLLCPGILLVLSSALFLVSCNPQPVAPVPPPPLGPDAVTFLGTTKNQNIFDPWYVPPCREDAKPVLMPESKSYDSVNDPALRVFCLIVDSRDHRYTGTPAALTAYRNAKVADYGTKTNQYWRETSYKNVSVSWTMPDTVVQLPGTYDDYFNRPFVAASLQTQGLTGRFPLTLNGTATATLHVRDAKNRNKDIVIAPNGTFPNAAALAIAFQNAADAVTGVPGDWVNCTASGSEVVCQLANLETAEASFIRVKSGAQLAMLGLEGPMEAPGAGSVPASLTGKNVGFPVTIPAGTRVDIEVRGKGDPNDEDAKVRQFQIPLTAGSVANPTALANLLLPALNSEFNWIESWDAGPNRLGLRLLSSESNNYAAIRIIGGINLQNLGLDGPIRVDGVISQPGTITVRGDRSDIISEALSLYLAKRAAATNTPIDLAHEDDLHALFNNEMGNFESYMVLFVEATTGIDGRRAGARASNTFNIRVPGAGGYVFTTQKQAGAMVGSGLQPWHVWAHELGHVLGFLDHYWKATYTQTFDRTHDYLQAWSMMDTDAAASHVDAWHKRKIRWIPPKQIADVPAPVNGLPQTHAFELIPLEFQPTDYPGFGTPAEPVRQLLRIKLSEHHWIYVENRQPAAVASKNLPDDALGLSPPDASGQAGGILVTDTADPFSEVLYRPAVTSLNPHGTGVPVAPASVQSRALHPGDSLDLNTTYPAYDGIRIRVTRAIPSPMSGTPEILAVEVDRWPGKFMDLELRPWHAPTEYATPDIWFDWAGNGEQLYAGVDPPLGTGDEVHWHPDGKVVMTIRVRVHNRGNLDATGVVVRTSINEPMGMGDKGTFVALPDSAPQDIPGGQSRDFAFEWKPNANTHTCVRAEIFNHSTAYGELDLNNNSAQENVTTFSPAAGSPYAPIDFGFKVNNDFPHPIVVDLMPSGLAPGMKLQLERKYVVLAADEEITLHGRLWLDENVIRPGPRGRRCDYRFNLHAMQRTEDSVLPFGGISIGVAPGVKSQLVHQEIVRDANGTAIYGRLEGDYRSNQQVDAALVGSNGRTYEGSAKTANNGSFKIVVPKVPSGPGNLMLFYFGPDMARSYLGPIKVTLP